MNNGPFMDDNHYVLPEDGDIQDSLNVRIYFFLGHHQSIKNPHGAEILNPREVWEGGSLGPFSAAWGPGSGGGESKP